MSAPLSNRLSVLAGQVQAAEQAMRRASHEAAERALEAGHLLIEAKGECRHGEWLRFLTSAGMAERQAQRLMQLARSGLKSDTVSDLGVKGALELAGKRRVPSAGTALLVLTGALGDIGSGHAWIWESAEHPRYFHVAGMGAGHAFVEATEKPVHADSQAVIFGYVDHVLGDDFDDWRFEELDVPRDLLERFRRAVVADPTDSPAGTHPDLDCALSLIEQADNRLNPLGFSSPHKIHTPKQRSSLDRLLVRAFIMGARP